MYIKKNENVTYKYCIQLHDGSLQNLFLRSGVAVQNDF